MLQETGCSKNMDNYNENDMDYYQNSLKIDFIEKFLIYTGIVLFVSSFYKISLPQ